MFHKFHKKIYCLHKLEKMRYIGNKENILDKIYSILKENNISGKTFFDFFSGTANVSKFFKEKNYQIFSSDILYLSYCLQKAYIENNESPKFDKDEVPMGCCEGCWSGCIGGPQH